LDAWGATWASLVAEASLAVGVEQAVGAARAEQRSEVADAWDVEELLATKVGLYGQLAAHI